MLEPENKHGVVAEWALGDAMYAVKNSLGDAGMKIGNLGSLIWGRTSRRLKMVGGFTLFM